MLNKKRRSPMIGVAKVGLKLTSIFIVMKFLTSLDGAFAQNSDEKLTIGQTKKVRYAVCRMDVGWNGRGNINNTYAAPSGWQILEFKPVVVSKRQRASYSFDLTPSNFAMTTTSIIDGKFDELFNVAAQAGKKDKYEGKINRMRSDYEKYYKKILTTHSQITTTGSVRGNNDFFSRRPGRLYLDLEITLVYYPDTEEQFARSIEVMKQIIQDDE